MYPPKHHQEYNIENIKKVALEYPFATLVSAKEKTPFVTHVPLVFHNDKLVGHIDKNNPHVELLKDNYPVTAIFQGPQTYISPSIYTTKSLPTWNYIIAHARGIVKEIKDSDIIKRSIVTMTEYLEAPNHRFVLDHNDERMNRLINYIHGFEIDIQHWEGKFKLSQDKVPADIENAKQELIKNNQNNIEDFVNQLFKNHF
ncbi:FMN-binding negative transcriptional regulator [Aquimarina algiphila]|uniref:FMN-binding negative transcriptional regulator n=1 Tax=Aquimarina algiphila TaxID=2047982 RepID=A0A554VR35_9FLAO|nr:FMN-binding negative transcriptional regulator [Aquimarina algiphila]TSE11073.1 FMN-binding negative transcriptional regulator [Aquimarina algiphila]